MEIPWTKKQLMHATIMLLEENKRLKEKIDRFESMLLFSEQDSSEQKK